MKSDVLNEWESCKEPRMALERARLRGQIAGMLSVLVEQRGTHTRELSDRLGKRTDVVAGLIRGDGRVSLDTLCDLFSELGTSLHVFADSPGARHYPQEMLRLKKGSCD